MKRLLPIGLLVLLLYNTFGLTFAVLFFDNHYENPSASSLNEELRVVKMHLPSLPYSGDLQITETPQGLIRENDQFYNPTQVSHQNDTLYVTLKSNQAARDQFVALASAMEMLSDPGAEASGAEASRNPYSKAIKMLDNLLKIYVSNANPISFNVGTFTEQAAPQVSAGFQNIYSAIFMQLTTPPPELS